MTANVDFKDPRHRSSPRHRGRPAGPYFLVSGFVGFALVSAIAIATSTQMSEGDNLRSEPVSGGAAVVPRPRFMVSDRPLEASDLSQPAATQAIAAGSRAVAVADLDRVAESVGFADLSSCLDSAAADVNPTQVLAGRLDGADVFVVAGRIEIDQQPTVRVIERGSCAAAHPKE